MKRIKKIRIKNFKAFQQEEVFTIKGKNVLVYGNNGSGKSSLFWALYTFLQSSIKTDGEVQKYFKQFDESDRGTHQSLKNIFMDEEEDAYIKLGIVDEETQVSTTYTISHDVINTNNNTDTSIQELNLASDFINYNLLQNFYRASHKNEVNLWPVFERDILPFLMEETSNKPWLDHIKGKTKETPQRSDGYTFPLDRGKGLEFKRSLDSLNQEIQDLLNEIATNANFFLKEQFYKNKDVLQVSLTFTKKFKYDDVKDNLWLKSKEFKRHSLLHIKLIVKMHNSQAEPPEWEKLHRVQSFLNETQLTRIAIGIRIGALRTRVQSTDFKVLVLDDMLISLDMPNRVDVVRIILNKDNKNELKYFDDFQKVILTHDKGFYNQIRRHAKEEDWVYFNFTKNENDISAPNIKQNKIALQKAVQYFEENEFENCGNELRKEAEAVLTTFLDPQLQRIDKEFEGLSSKLDKAFKILTNERLQNFQNIFLTDIDLEKLKKIKTDFSEDADLDADEKASLTRLQTKLFDFLIEFNEKKNQKEILIKETKEILDRVLNAASHHGDNPLHRDELKDAIESIKDLKDHLT